MAKKKKVSKPVAKSSTPKRKKADVWTIKRIWLPIGLAVIALVFASNVEYTRDVQSNVLGDESESHGSEQSREQNDRRGGDDQREEQKPSGGVNFRFEDHKGSLELKAVDDHGRPVATAEAERKEIEKELDDKDVDVASIGGEVELSHKGQRVRTNFPLSINPVTHELTVTTPAGTKVVAILPDQAINNMIRNGFLTSVTSPSGSGETSSASADLKLTLHNDEAVYEIHGEKKAKFLGVVPVTLDRTVMVSTQNGSVVAQKESMLSRLLGFLSF